MTNSLWKHIFGVWVRTFRGFVSYPGGPAAYFALITSVEKTITQVGQVGAVVIADAMTVRLSSFV